jgi:predicted CXXCH cytochrome family protein
MEGPFIYEHPPVTEDCMICHTPHGSVANSLLKQGEPALCLNCHSMHFHAGIVGVDGEFDTPQAPERGGFSTPDAWKRVMLTKCTQCHSEIHGSDLPSQSISGQGRSLTR